MACIQTLSKKIEKCVEKPTSRNERVTKQVNICKFSYKNLMIYKFFELKVTIYIFSVQKDAQNLFVKKGLTILWDCPINTKNNDKQIVLVFFSFIQHTVN